jgi:hypothetical protein
MAETIESARKLIENRLAELQSEAAGLERALKGLGEGTAVPGGSRRRSRRSTPRRSPARRRRGKRAAPGQRQAELLRALKEKPGARPTELARTIGVKPAQVHALLRKAKAEKLIAKQGRGYKLKRS